MEGINEAQLQNGIGQVETGQQDQSLEAKSQQIKKVGGGNAQEKRDIRTVPQLASLSECCCIYKVHEIFHKTSKHAYTPLLVSIGSFHRGKTSLQPMEDVKSVYMHKLLSRVAGKKSTQLAESNARDNITWLTLLEECVESITGIETDARKHYSENINLESKEFVEILVVDGLFIFELLLQMYAGGNSTGLCNNFWDSGILPWDLLLLENQLPMIVLQHLFRLISSDNMLEGKLLTEILLVNWEKLSILPIRKNALRMMHLERTSSMHLLDLLAKMFRPRNFQRDEVFLSSPRVKFKKGSTEVSFLDVKFSDDGVLEIPPIIINDRSDLLFRNLIASEQFSSGDDTKYMTSYAFFMDSLINSEQDVALLRKKGIITICFGSDTDVADLFNNLCRDRCIARSYYSQTNDRVNEIYKKRPNFWKATLKHDYFNNPWSICSFVAALLLIGLTLTASIFAILSFAIHKS
ncbi:hypothetical protein C5167_026639 [Papaver somniferum]|nr:hypothetical protein C5167_026639 [Papaver somniferum]